MTGPGGIQTKRDQRRDTRRGQFQQRQLERQRQRQREIRRQRTIRYASIGGGLVVFLLVMGLIVHAVTSGSGGSTPPRTTNGPHVQYTTPATGDTRDGLQCLGYETVDQHIHAYLAIYENGKQVPVPEGIGLPSPSCIYPLHVHYGQPNIIHVEAPNQNTFTLGQFFDIWGQPLSATQVGDVKTDATHTLQFVTIDGDGTKHTYTGDPWRIPIKAHETIVVLYNSPNVQPTPYANWGNL